MIARGQKGLAWDTTDIQTGATHLPVLLNNGSFQSELSGTNRRNITTRSGANNYNIKFIHDSEASRRRIGDQSKSIPSLVGSSRHSLTRTRNVTASLPSTAR